jgi:hypothetical protein
MQVIHTAENLVLAVAAPGNVYLKLNNIYIIKNVRYN